MEDYSFMYEIGEESSYEIGRRGREVVGSIKGVKIGDVITTSDHPKEMAWKVIRIFEKGVGVEPLWTNLSYNRFFLWDIVDQAAFDKIEEVEETEEEIEEQFEEIVLTPYEIIAQPTEDHLEQLAFKF